METESDSEQILVLIKFKMFKRKHESPKQPESGILVVVNEYRRVIQLEKTKLRGMTGFG